MIFSTSFTGSAGQLLFALNCVWLNFSIIARFNLVALNEREDARVQPRVERRSRRRCIFDGIVQQVQHQPRVMDKVKQFGRLSGLQVQHQPRVMDKVKQFGRLSGLQVQPTKSKIILLNIFMKYQC